MLAVAAAKCNKVTALMAYCANYGAVVNGLTENAKPENTGRENDGPNSNT